MGAAHPDWTGGPAKWVAAGAIIGASAVGFAWSLSSHRAEPAFRQVAPAQSQVHASRGMQPGETDDAGLGVEAGSAQKMDSEAERKPDEPQPIEPDADEPISAADADEAGDELESEIDLREPVEEDRDETQRAPDESPIARRININTASTAELELLKGIGPALAARIIDDRDRRGPFRSIDDLKRVRGIGPKTVEAIRPMASVK